MDEAKRLSLTVWRSLTSVRLLVHLVTSVLVTLVIASLLPQFPPDSAVMVPWLQPADLRHLQTTGLIQVPGMFEAFPALWYLVLVAGLLLRLVAGSEQRPLRLWTFLARPLTTVRPGEFYRSHILRQESPVSSLQEGLEAAGLAPRASPCRMYTEYDALATCAHPFAVRVRWRQTGTVVNCCHRNPCCGCL